MGCFDEVVVECPSCSHDNFIQSKAGQCRCITYKLQEAPMEIVADIRDQFPYSCQQCNRNIELRILFDVWVR